MNITLKEHYGQIRKILIYVLVLNWLVAIIKILYGLITRCQSITADGFHSLSDGASNIIGLIGIALASRPTDKNHPYGHRRYETFFSLGVAALLVIICFNLFKGGISRLFTPVMPQVDIKSFLVIIFTLIINIIVVKYEYSKGKLLKSDILISDSLHTRADIFVSLSVLIALIVIKSGYPIFDPLITIIISLLIGHSAYDILKRCSDVLCDTAPIVDVKKIVDIVLCIKGTKTCHKVRTRGSNSDIHIDLHVQVNPNMHIDQAHKISYSIEDAIKKNIPGVSDVVVHMEPQK